MHVLRFIAAFICRLCTPWKPDCVLILDSGARGIVDAWGAWEFRTSHFYPCFGLSTHGLSSTDYPLSLQSCLVVVLVSVQFSHSVVSDSLRPNESQHTRPPCPSPTPRVHPTHVHRVSDAIQPSHPLSSPSPPAPNPSRHHSLFQWVNSSHEVIKVLKFQL